MTADNDERRTALETIAAILEAADNDLSKAMYLRIWNILQEGKPNGGTAFQLLGMLGANMLIKAGGTETFQRRAAYLLYVYTCQAIEAAHDGTGERLTPLN